MTFPSLRRYVLAPSLALAWALTAVAQSPASIRVALYNDVGAAGKGVPNTREILKKAGCTVTLFKAADLADGVLENKDVVVFTGGSGSQEGAAIGEAGRAAVSKFVENGGGYLG